MSTKFLNATYLKSADKHILHTYAQMCTHMLVSFFFFLPLLALTRTHAHKLTRTCTHAHSTTGMYYKYTLRRTHPSFRKHNTLRCCPSIGMACHCIHSWFMTCSSATKSGKQYPLHESGVTARTSLLISHEQ